jgi:hypothetical protein
MADFSKLPQEALDEARLRGYVGVYFEQGVPVLDRDLNLLQDLVAATVRTIAGRYIGDGSAPGSGAFAIGPTTPPSGDLVISGPGHCLVGGIEVEIGAAVAYAAQVPPPAERLTVPTADRVDVVYLDVSLTTVAGDGPGADPDLLNDADVGMQTSIRVKPAWTVRVAEGTDRVPDTAPGHAHYGLALLRRTPNAAAIDDTMITDLRQTALSVDEVEKRLRRVEESRLQPRLIEGDEPFTPLSQAPGGTVTIKGANFDLPELKVRFGQFEARTVVVRDANTIVATVPGAASGSVPITVQTVGGAVRSTVLFTFRVGAPGPRFADPPDEFEPRSGPARTVVTLAGSGFRDEQVAVRFGDAGAQLGSVSPNAVEAIVPDAVAGRVAITISTSKGHDVSRTLFTAGTPPVLDPREPFTPGGGGIGSTVSIKGKGFDAPGAVVVTFGDARANVRTVTATLIEVDVPPDAPQVSTITVTTAVGSDTSTARFTIRRSG